MCREHQVAQDARHYPRARWAWLPMVDSVYMPHARMDKEVVARHIGKPRQSILNEKNPCQRALSRCPGIKSRFGKHFPFLHRKLRSVLETHQWLDDPLVVSIENAVCVSESGVAAGKRVARV